MININPSLVRNIIIKVKQLHAKADTTLPNEGGSAFEDDTNIQFVETDLIYTELELLIDDLDPDQQAALVALLWIGREDYMASEWDEALQNAEENLFKKPSSYLLSQPLIADYLEEGLNQMGYEVVDA